MPREVNHYPHSARVAINFFIIWTPYYRKKALVGPVKARLKELAEQEVPLAEIAMQYDFEILAVEVLPVLAYSTNVFDHVDLFVSAPPKFLPTQIVDMFKGITSRQLKTESESL